MNSIRLIAGLARREAVERASSRAFQISTLILVIATAAAVILPGAFGGGDPDPYRVGVVDPRAGIEDALAASTFGERDVEVTEFDDREAAEAALTADDDPIEVALHGDEMIWEAEPDSQLESVVRSAVTQTTIIERADNLGIDAAEVGGLLAPVEVSSVSLDDAADDEDRGAQTLIATIGMILLFISIAFYGSYILMSVVEEKQNRVVEVLLAHVEPRDLLAGKVVGHGVLGLGQMLAIAVVAVAGLLITDPPDVPAGAYGQIAAVLLWFLLGYAFYSILYAALGSLASRNEDAQSAIGPVMVVLMGSYFAAFAVIDNPDNILAVIGSFVPFTSPMMMPIRTAVSDVPLWQPLLAIAILLVSIVGTVRLGGRLYRGAVLRVGRKLSIREAWQATS